MFRKNEEGFSLIELLITLIIIGILALFAVPKLFDSVDEATEVYALSEINLLNTKLDKIYREFGYVSMLDILEDEGAINLTDSKNLLSHIETGFLFNSKGLITESDDFSTLRYFEIDRKYLEEEMGSEPPKGSFYLGDFRGEQNRQKIDIVFLFEEE